MGYFTKKEIKGFRYKLKLDNNGAEVESILEPIPLKGRKAKKEFHKITAIVEVGGYKFQADEGSINYMSSVLAIASAKFNEALASGMNVKDAYTLIYEQTIPWKDADNVFRNVKLKDIATGLQAAMEKIKEIISQY